MTIDKYRLESMLELKANLDGNSLFGTGYVLVESAAADWVTLVPGLTLCSFVRLQSKPQLLHPQLLPLPDLGRQSEPATSCLRRWHMVRS